MTYSESKQQKVMACLKAYNTLSQKESIELFQHYRLASVVDRMKKQGYNIKNIGDPGKFAVYKRQRKAALI
jgi:hypothetical protein